MVLDRVPPLLVAAFSTVLGGTSFVASRYAVTEGDPAEIAFLRYGLAAILFFAAARWTGGRWPKIARADLAPNLALGVAMFGGFTWLFTAATQYIPAARAALIVAAMPVIALAFAWALGRERATWTKAAACALAAIGVAVALGDKATGGPEAWKGDAYMILAALVGGAHTVVSTCAAIRRCRRSPSSRSRASRRWRRCWPRKAATRSPWPIRPPDGSRSRGSPCRAGS
jgi:drug/metabolite transporter (DMT)-like permease